MAWEHVDAFFQQYVFGFIFRDVDREIALGRTSVGGGNLLASLGLLCYTEMLGGVDRETWSVGEGRANFNAFVRRMGAPYQALADRMNLYRVFRCGMAHQYASRVPCDFEMGRGGAPSGLYEVGGRFHFNVEAYFCDFARAARELYEELRERDNPTLPESG